MTRGARRGGSSGAPRSVDVARVAGVSQKTVSRVFNDEPYVSADVRRRVLEAADELGYRLNNAARALASGRTRSIGVVTLGTALYGPASLIMGVERAVRDTGYALRVVNTMEGDPAGVAPAVHSLLDQGVDGIVISEPIDDGRDGDLAARLDVDVPVLVLGAPPFSTPRSLVAGVGADVMARTATEYLLDLGHVTVHHLAGPQRWFAARDRAQGWRSALVGNGRAVPPVIEGDWSAASGYAAGRRLASDAGVTAVFTANDDMAIGLIRALTEAGRRVPEDVSVVGFDDIPVAAYVTPPLTTIRQPFDVVAQEGIKRLVHIIENPQADPLPASEPPVDLILRASTGPPPTRPPRDRGRRIAHRPDAGGPAPPAQATAPAQN
ncbi:DNA-binding LacI/PurR family transcriptional regulator [Streptomyces sp. B4I13]|uniref:LacI family DNA-binding transcriptional regulator n=1 Tax=Streptomyces sp. B4I13 TaxID=3042271 RepID=UPI002788425B|nr:LacI family DNA-binding transcriptional regulator [Streptomyces sp. B4I13]MDQ0956646.1 DNA-binding LacI/PurR family transcriptional regulator [Streptomyces sp. B4I13]